MRPIQSARVYLNIFYFLGQSPFFINVPRDQHSNSLACSIKTTLPSYIFVFVYFSCAAECLYTFLSNENKNHFGFTDTFMMQFTVTCDLFRSYCLFRQCSHHRQLIYDVMNAIDDLRTIFTKDLHHLICYNRFLCRFSLKALLFLAIYVSSIISPVTQFLIWLRFDPGLVRIKSLQIMGLVGILYIVFNVDLVRYYTEQLNLTIQRDAQIVRGMSASARNQTIRNRLKCYKIIHFRLSEITQRLSQYFGWNLILIFLKAFVHSVFTAYWQIGLFKKTMNFARLIRMYFNGYFVVQMIQSQY